MGIALLISFVNWLKTNLLKKQLLLPVSTGQEMIGQGQLAKEFHLNDDLDFLSVCFSFHFLVNMSQTVYC